MGDREQQVSKWERSAVSASQLIEDALDADEVFTTGTAVVVASVGSLTYQGKRVEFNGGQPGKCTMDMYQTLVSDSAHVASPASALWTYARHSLTRSFTDMHPHRRLLGVSPFL